MNLERWFLWSFGRKVQCPNFKDENFISITEKSYELLGLNASLNIFIYTCWFPSIMQLDLSPRLFNKY